MPSCYSNSEFLPGDMFVAVTAGARRDIGAASFIIVSAKPPCCHSDFMYGEIVFLTSDGSFDTRHTGGWSSEEFLRVSNQCNRGV